MRIDLETGAELEPVTHVHPVKEDVCLAIVRLIPEKQACPAVKLVEPTIRLVSELLEEAADLNRVRAEAHEIQIGVGTTQPRTPGGGAAQINRPSPYQTQGDVRLRHRRRDPPCLLIHACLGLRAELAHTSSRVRDVISSMMALCLNRSFTRSYSEPYSPNAASYTSRLSGLASSRSPSRAMLATAVGMSRCSPLPTAASIAAPSTAASPWLGTTTGIWQTSALICDHRRLFAPPPRTRSSLAPTPSRLIPSRSRLIMKATASMIARVKCALPCPSLKPKKTALACGSNSGKKAPSRWGNMINPWLPAGTLPASSVSCS